MNEEMNRKRLNDLAERLLEGRKRASIDVCKVLHIARMSEADLRDLIYHYQSSEAGDRKYTFEKDFNVVGEPENYRILITAKS